MPAERILIVDDEPDILELVGFHLEQAGFEVATAASGSAALEQLRAAPPALVVLDIMLPDLSGTELLRVLRQDSKRRVPVIMLTARTEEVDRVVGFELGADDYVTKPFSPRELALRVKSVLRRSMELPAAGREVLALGEIRLDAGRHRCEIDGEQVDLTAKEFSLLRMLMVRPGRVFAREQLLQEIWGAGVHVTPRTIDTHMKRLREKLGPAGEQISTVRGVGYRIDG